MSLFSEQNAKMKAGSKLTGRRWLSFGIPAGVSGAFLTCPNMKDCAFGCYAKQGFYVFAAVKSRLKESFELSRTDQFFQKICGDLFEWKRKGSRDLVVRIHESGDFYNEEYFRKWVAIMTLFPTATFYAYTKMVTLVKGLEWLHPSNFIAIYSMGGKEDNLIQPDWRHSAVFNDNQKLSEFGYADASESDYPAVFGTNPRIGLMYHGNRGKSREWLSELPAPRQIQRSV